MPCHRRKLQSFHLAARIVSTPSTASVSFHVNTKFTWFDEAWCLLLHSYFRRREGKALCICLSNIQIFILFPTIVVLSLRVSWQDSRHVCHSQHRHTTLLSQSAASQIREHKRMEVEVVANQRVWNSCCIAGKRTHGSDEAYNIFACLSLSRIAAALHNFSRIANNGTPNMMNQTWVTPKYLLSYYVAHLSTSIIITVKFTPSRFCDIGVSRASPNSFLDHYSQILSQPLRPLHSKFTRCSIAQ